MPPHHITGLVFKNLKKELSQTSRGRSRSAVFWFFYWVSQVMLHGVWLLSYAHRGLGSILRLRSIIYPRYPSHTLRYCSSNGITNQAGLYRSVGSPTSSSSWTYNRTFTRSQIRPWWPSSASSGWGCCIRNSLLASLRGGHVLWDGQPRGVASTG